MRHLAVVVAMLMMLCLATPGACSPAARAPVDEVLSEPLWERRVPLDDAVVEPLRLPDDLPSSEPLRERRVLVDDPWVEPLRLPDDPPSSEPLRERRVLSEQLDDPWVEPQRLAVASSEPRPVLAAL